MTNALNRFASATFVGVFASSLAIAQSWPSQPVKLIVGYTPGTGIDIVARSVGQKLSERLGQPFVVENKPVTGASITHVPYKGTAGAFTDLIAGQISVMFVPIHVAMTQIRAGKLKALALGSPKRHPGAPDVPTLVELGVSGVEVDIWYGFFAPAGTSRDIVTKLNGELKAILALPEIQASFASQGLDPFSSTAEEFQSMIERDIPRWAKVVRDARIPAE